MTDGKAFLDTNILFRFLHSQIALHTEVRVLVKRIRDQEYQLWISRQVIREYIVQVTRPGLLAAPLTGEQVETQINLLRQLFNVADDTNAVTSALVELLKQYPTGGKQVHDANIVATMLAYNIDTLLTLNVDDLKRFGDRIKIVSINQ